MKQRELLVTAKAAQTWHDHFNERVEELMALVGKVDTDKQVQQAAELLDVYHKTKQKPGKGRKKKVNDTNDRPFEFLVFRN